MASPMIDIGFYQLATRRADAVLPQLVTKALAAGHRLVVRADTATLANLDLALWNHAADSFIPHGIAADLGPGRAANQPVLLVDALPAANGADCLAQVGGDLPDDLTGFARVLFLFDADNLETARGRWRGLARDPGLRTVYWRESEGGRFEKAG